jgi:hypothetical protein
MTRGHAERKVLPADHRRALSAAADVLSDTTLADGELRADKGWTADAWIMGGSLPRCSLPRCSLLRRSLPRRSLHRYTPSCAWKLFVCFLTVVWKLGQPRRSRLSCTAEELAVTSNFPLHPIG